MHYKQVWFCRGNLCMGSGTLSEDMSLNTVHCATQCRLKLIKKTDMWAWSKNNSSSIFSGKLDWDRVRNCSLVGQRKFEIILQGRPCIFQQHIAKLHTTSITTVWLIVEAFGCSSGLPGVQNFHCWKHLAHQKARISEQLECYISI